MSTGWRAEDEALLHRLEDERVFRAAWTSLESDLGVPLEAPHRRAAGVVRALRDTSGELVANAELTGDYAALARAFESGHLKGLTPRLAHHRALLSEHLADRQVERDPARAQKASDRAMRMWLWLAHEESYLAELGDKVIGSALPEVEVRRLVDEVPETRIRRLGEIARQGSESLSSRSATALRTLSQVEAAAAAVELSTDHAKRLTTLARRERAAAIDEAITRVDGALEDALSRDASSSQIVALLFDAVAVWRYAGRDELVERYLVRKTTPYLWDLYRQKSWDEVRAVLRPLVEVVNHMAKRILSDPSKLAYAAPCAQMFVFRAEVAKAFDQQITLIERALELCATHRNAHLVLADLLLERADRALDRSMPWSSGDALGAALKDVRRAEELYPQLKRLPKIKQRLRALGYRFDDD